MAQSTDVFIAGPVRTPIGKFGGVFAGMTAPELGAAAATAALQRAGIRPTDVEETIMGTAAPPGSDPTRRVK